MLYFMIKLSAGTAHVLGMKRLKTDAPPTTAYLMAGEGCSNDCSFCAQATNSDTDKDNLSRIRWQKFKQEDIIDNLSLAAKDNKLKRTCIQVVDTPSEKKLSVDFLRQLKEQVGLPTCVSKKINSLAEVKELLSAGADRVNIALDVVSSVKYQEIKGGSYYERYQLLTRAAKKFPGKISTHIIVGLGENEAEIIKLLVELKELKVKTGIFAFTPLSGTKLADHPRPDIGKYRRVQIANYLIYKHNFKLNNFIFSDGKLINIDIQNEELKQLLSDGKAFETVGCPDCNRPYYNEKPGGIIYNYPRSLEFEEIKEALNESQLVFNNE